MFFPSTIFLFICFFYVTSDSTAEENGFQVIINPNTNPVQKPSGHQISLVCSVKGNGQERPGIMWKKHGGLDRTGNVEVKKLDDKNIGIVIRNSTVEDSGVYVCQAQLGNRIVTSQVDVVVFEDMMFLDKQLQFGEIMATASVNISCEVTAKKETVITYWTRHGRQIIEGGRFKFYRSSRILEIQNYQPEDAGQYTCEVFHMSSGSSLTKTVNLGTVDEKNFVACQQNCNAMCSDANNKIFSRTMV